MEQEKRFFKREHDTHHDLLIEAVNAVRDYAIFMLDPQGYVLTWNEGAERIKGYAPSEIIGKHFSAFYTKEDLKRNHPWDELAIATRDGRFEEEGWRVRKNGTLFWASVVITALKDAHGKVLGFSKVTRDLTDRRKAEDALRASEERFRQLVEGVKDYAIFLLDPKGFVVTWNEGATRLKGYLPGEVIGKHFSQFYPPEDIAAGKCDFELEEASLTGRYEEEGWRIRKDGTRFWANVVITAIRDGHGKVTGFSKVTRDLTERRRAEERLKRANEELEKRVAQRTIELSHAKQSLEAAMRSRDEFLSIASHELKTPITSLKLQAQMLLSKFDAASGKTPPIPRAVAGLGLIVAQSDRLSALVEYMLDISRAQLGKFTYEFNQTDISELVTNIANQWQEPFAANGAGFTAEVEAGISGKIDSYRIEQVLLNLLSNAMKYAAGKTVTLNLRRIGQTAVIRVKDDGPGIESSRQTRVFERFERGENVPGVTGFGLGLFISKTIVEAHHGTISLDSAPGKGAEFTILLPLNVAQVG